MVVWALSLTNKGLFTICSLKRIDCKSLDRCSISISIHLNLNIGMLLTAYDDGMVHFEGREARIHVDGCSALNSMSLLQVFQYAVHFFFSICNILQNMQQSENLGTCAFLRSPPVLPPKIGAGVLGSRLGGDQGFFSSFFSSFFSFVAPSAETATLHHKIFFSQNNFEKLHFSESGDTK